MSMRVVRLADQYSMNALVGTIYHDEPMHLMGEPIWSVLWDNGVRSNEYDDNLKVVD